MSSKPLISAEPIVPGAGNPLAYNRYAYVFNNPIMYTDPSGHSLCKLDCTTRDDQVIEDLLPDDQLINQPSTDPQYTQDVLEDALSTFDVEVEFAPGISDYEIVDSLAIILHAVRSYTAAFFNIGLNWWDMMGTTYIHVRNLSYLTRLSDEQATNEAGELLFDEEGRPIMKQYYLLGENSQTSTSGPAFFIELALEALLGNLPEDNWNPEAQGVNLIAHELGHNLTWQGYDFPDAENLSLRGMFGVNAASTSDSYEYSADAFASWALDSWGEDTSSAFQRALSTDIGGYFQDNQ